MKRSLKFLALLAALSAMPSCSWFSKHPVIPAVVTCSGETIPIALVTRTYDDAMTENWVDLAENVVPLLKDGYADLTCIWNYLGTSNPETLPHINAMKAKHAAEFKGLASCSGSPTAVVALLPADAIACARRCGDGGWSLGSGGCVCRTSEALRSPGDATPKTGPTAATGALGLPATDMVPAIGCLNGTVLRETAPGDWNCMRPDALPSGAKTLTIYAYPGSNPGTALERCDRTCGEHLTSLATVDGCECHRKINGVWRWVAAR